MASVERVSTLKIFVVLVTIQAKCIKYYCLCLEIMPLFALDDSPGSLFPNALPSNSMLACRKPFVASSNCISFTNLSKGCLVLSANCSYSIGQTSMPDRRRER